MATFVDHYAVLGVKSTANLAAIKKAYRQLALQHHPDKAASGGQVDAAKFISAQAAYEILVDVAKRRAYDIQYDKRSKAAHATRLAHKQATRLARFYQRETDGSYGGGYGRQETCGDEEDEVVEDYPSDTPTDPGSEAEDTGVYEDGYADPHYKPNRRSDDVVHGSFYSYGICVGDLDFESTDSRYQFPDDFADDFSPAQGCDDEWDADSESHGDEENPAPCISHPVSEAFDAFANMSKSHYLEEKVLGRYYSKHKSFHFSTSLVAPSAVFQNVPECITFRLRSRMLINTNNRGRLVRPADKEDRVRQHRRAARGYRGAREEESLQNACGKFQVWGVREGAIAEAGSGSRRR